jgi:LPS export ABC transporter protein LptC
LLRGRLFLLLLMLALAGSAWLAWLQPETGILSLDRNGEPLADYYLTGLTLDQFGPDGSLQRTLKAERLDHHAGQGTRLDQPRLTVQTRSGSPWLIVGERGHLDPAGELLTLSDQVQITRLATPHNRPVRLTTRDLRYRPGEGYAETDEAVTVTSDRDRVDAVGMQAWLLDPARIHFRSQVRGHYEP